MTEITGTIRLFYRETNFSEHDWESGGFGVQLRFQHEGIDITVGAKPSVTVALEVVSEFLEARLALEGLAALAAADDRH